MLTDAIDIMRFITCPSCEKRTIDTYLIEQLKHEHKNKPVYSTMKPSNQNQNVVDNLDGTMSSTNTNTKVENANVHLYLTCGNCKFTIKIINKAWLKIFHAHAFGI